MDVSHPTVGSIITANLNSSKAKTNLFHRRNFDLLHFGAGLHSVFLGCTMSLVLNPAMFWEKKAQMALLSLCANFILGCFMVFIHDVDLSDRIFSNVNPQRDPPDQPPLQRETVRRSALPPTSPLTPSPPT
ncbi:Cytochrome P450 710A1 [Nymphaea thermarum]|nr:Cytochrome P450 710A1 [Nymphaea thermarum]